MGHPAVGDWLPVDFSRAVAALAKGIDAVAGIVWSPAFRRPGPRKRGTPSAPGYSFAGFTRGFVFAQVSSL
jgi:hypothetical protein